MILYKVVSVPVTERLEQFDELKFVSGASVDLKSVVATILDKSKRNEKTSTGITTRLAVTQSIRQSVGLPFNRRYSVSYYKKDDCTAGSLILDPSLQVIATEQVSETNKDLNQDAIAISSDSRFFVVADGNGSYPDKEGTAAYAADLCKTAIQIYEERAVMMEGIPDTELRSVLSDSLKICAHMYARSQVGASLSVGYLHSSGKLYYIQLGDASIGLMSEDKLLLSKETVVESPRDWQDRPVTVSPVGRHQTGWLKAEARYEARVRGDYLLALSDDFRGIDLSVKSVDLNKLPGIKKIVFGTDGLWDCVELNPSTQVHRFPEDQPPRAPIEKLAHSPREQFDPPPFLNSRANEGLKEVPKKRFPFSSKKEALAAKPFAQLFPKDKAQMAPKGLKPQTEFRSKHRDADGMLRVVTEVKRTSVEAAAAVAAVAVKPDRKASQAIIRKRKSKDPENNVSTKPTESRVRKKKRELSCLVKGERVNVAIINELFHRRGTVSVDHLLILKDATGLHKVSFQNYPKSACLFFFHKDGSYMRTVISFKALYEKSDMAKFVALCTVDHDSLGFILESTNTELSAAFEHAEEVALISEEKWQELHRKYNP